MVSENERKAIKALEALYRALDKEAAELGECKACGRCCHFKTYGHRLYATYVEALYQVQRSGHPPRAFDDDTCGYQEGSECKAREGRVLGCRTFFCGRETAEARRIHEAALEGIKRITLEFGLPWRYRPLGEHMLRLEGAVLPEVQTP